MQHEHADEVLRTIKSDGLCVYRKFLDARDTSSLLGIADWLYTKLASAENPAALGETAAATYILSTSREWSGLQHDTVDEFLAEQDGEQSGRFSETTAHVTERALSVLGRGWRWKPEGSFFRRLSQKPAHVAWHSDAEAASTLALGYSVINMWVPLVEVGAGMPSIEFVRGSHTVMRNPSSPMPNDRHRSEEWVSHVDGERVTPRLAPGDVIFFDEFTLHRTQTVEAPFSERTSCEFRFAYPGNSRQQDES